MANSHYVPKFSLKRFNNDKICVFNVVTGKYEENIKIEKAFSQKGFYTKEIEKKLNEKIENSFAKTLKK